MIFLEHLLLKCQSISMFLFLFYMSLLIKGVHITFHTLDVKISKICEAAFFFSCWCSSNVFIGCWFRVQCHLLKIII